MALKKFLNSRDSEIVEFAISQLGSISTSKSVVVLEPFLDSVDPALELLALNSLKNLGSLGADTIASKLPRLTRFGEEYCLALKEVSWRPTGEEAAWYFAIQKEWTSCLKLGPESAVKALLVHSYEYDKVIESFGNDAQPYLLTAIADSNLSWKERKHAASVLGQIGDDSASAPLRSQLEHLNDNICYIDSYESAVAKKEDQTEMLRAGIIESLSKFSDEENCIAIDKALDDESAWVRSAAAESLGRLNYNSSIPKLLHQFERDIDHRELKAIAKSLAMMNVREAVDLIREKLNALKEELNRPIIEHRSAGRIDLHSELADSLASERRDSCVSCVQVLGDSLNRLKSTTKSS